MSHELLTAFREAIDDEATAIELTLVAESYGGIMVDLNCESLPGEEDLEFSALSHRHDRDWEACKGRLQLGDLHVCVQGKRGTMGPHVDVSDKFDLRCWIGRMEVPAEVVADLDGRWHDAVAHQLETDLYNLRHRFERVDLSARRRMIQTGGVWTDALGALNALTARSMP